MYKTSAAALCMLMLAVSAGRSETPDDTSRISSSRLIVLGALTLGTGVAVHIYQADAWWQGPRAPFRFENDWDYALNVDKMGHMYGAYLLSHLFGYGLAWSGVDRWNSVLYGSLFGLAYQLYVETEDGFHKDYGFSPGDGIADVAGAMVPLLQESMPALTGLALKWSYFPSTEYRDELKSTPTRVFIDDYQGQIYWVSYMPRCVMAQDDLPWFPSWLGLAWGYAARSLNDPIERHSMWALALDVSLSRIHTGSPFVDALFTALDHVHFPLPGVLFERGVAKFGLVY